jgi:hypothetical protein
MTPFLFNIIILIGAFLFIDPSLAIKDGPLKVGTYKNFKPSKAQAYWIKLSLRYNSYMLGSSVELKADSTFIYQTCGNIEIGKWTIEEDSLVLYVSDGRHKNDSINAINLPANQEWHFYNDTIKYKIKDHSIFRTVHLKPYKALEKMVFSKSQQIVKYDNYYHYRRHPFDRNKSHKLSRWHTTGI